MTTLTINGEARSVKAEPDTPLLWVLRGELGLTGTKFGCGMALCGACTVHVDGEPVRACVTPIAGLDGRQVTTIEGLSGPVPEAVQQAWDEVDVAQCGYCQSGQVMTACALLKRHPQPTRAQVDEALGGNLCRCGAYPRIRRAIDRAAQALSKT